ncbi:MAG: T9SS type A sorting domain-containing protein, partial [Bacteroidota bacterium]|nr:T9SS type A sorting domain-containing protein [Bacteroidota bacterium]
GDSNGSIYANGIGGDGNYTYLWEDITNPGITLSTDSAISSLEAGTYNCYVTDGCGCISMDTYTLTEPNGISLNIDSLTDITIYGGSDGSIYISSTGGSGLLSTSWTSDNGFSSNNEDITNLLSGFYYIEITDSNSCTYLDTIELTEPSSLWMNLDLATNASCFDSCNGALNITANGGDSTYTYTWTGPNGFTSTNDDLTNLCDGAYIITVDDGITTLTDTFNVYQPQAITSNLLVDSIMCHNDVAQAEINVWGGTQPLIYNWSNGGNSYITTVSSGAHSINVTDQNGCSISHSFSLTNPDSIISTTTSTSINCSGGNDGSASISIISGGAPPYAYLWSNGQTTNIATGLSAGTYSCTITDANGCLDSASVDVVEPDEIISITSSIDASCYNYCDGSVSVTTTGGIPPYSYVWTNGQSTQTATGLCAGSYNVTITDDNSCSVIHSAIVNEPNPLLINIWINGSDLVATNGFSTYQWYTASGTLIPGATSEIFNPSSMGEYYVSVTDSNGCSENSLIIDYNISGLNSLDQSIKIYPNPTNGFLTIEGTHAINSITVMTSIGNQLLKVENNNNEVSSTKLDLSTFAKGIYFIQIKQNNQIVNYRIVLQ